MALVTIQVLDVHRFIEKLDAFQRAQEDFRDSMGRHDRNDRRVLMEALDVAAVQVAQQIKGAVAR